MILELIVKRLRNAPMAIARESHPRPKNHVLGLSHPSPQSQFKRTLSYQTSTYYESHHDEGPMIVDRVIGQKPIDDTDVHQEYRSRRLPYRLSFL